MAKKQNLIEGLNFDEIVCPRTKAKYSSYSKNRYWTGVFYTENMREDWRECLGSFVQYPYCAILHDKDTNKDGTHRKDHIHLLVVWGNNTTALTVFKMFMQVGRALSVNDNNTFGHVTLEPVAGVRNLYDYFIHDTKDARSKNKYVYDASERLEGNQFDIGAYEQIGKKDENELLDEICHLITDNDFQDFYELNLFVITHFDISRKAIFRKNQNYFKNIVEGKYKHEKRLREREKEAKKKKCREEYENLKKQVEESKESE